MDCHLDLPHHRTTDHTVVEWCGYANWSQCDRAQSLLQQPHSHWRECELRLSLKLVRYQSGTDCLHTQWTSLHQPLVISRRLRDETNCKASVLVALDHLRVEPGAAVNFHSEWTDSAPGSTRANNF